VHKEGDKMNQNQDYKLPEPEKSFLEEMVIASVDLIPVIGIYTSYKNADKYDANKLKDRSLLVLKGGLHGIYVAHSLIYVIENCF